MLLDIATEELSHLEVIGSIIVMMNKGVKGRLAEGTGDGELLAEITQGELTLARPDLGQIAASLLPIRQIILDPEMLYIAIGMLGAWVMPQPLYLHSANRTDT